MSEKRGKSHSFGDEQQSFTGSTAKEPCTAMTLHPNQTWLQATHGAESMGREKGKAANPLMESPQPQRLSTDAIVGVKATDLCDQP